MKLSERFDDEVKSEFVRQYQELNFEKNYDIKLKFNYRVKQSRFGVVIYDKNTEDMICFVVFRNYVDRYREINKGGQYWKYRSYGVPLIYVTHVLNVEKELVKLKDILDKHFLSCCAD